jgi:hypothetical protein
MTDCRNFFYPSIPSSKATSYDLNFDAHSASAVSADLNEMDDEGGTKQTLTRWLARQHSKGHDTRKLLSEIRQYVFRQRVFFMFFYIFYFTG